MVFGCPVVNKTANHFHTNQLARVKSTLLSLALRNLFCDVLWKHTNCTQLRHKPQFYTSEDDSRKYQKLHSIIKIFFFLGTHNLMQIDPKFILFQQCRISKNSLAKAGLPMRERSSSDHHALNLKKHHWVVWRTKKRLCWRKTHKFRDDILSHKN